MTLLVWLFSQMIETRCPGFQTGFCHMSRTDFLTRELWYVGFKDLCPKPEVKVLGLNSIFVAMIAF